MTLPRLLPLIILLFFSDALSAQSALRDGKDYAIFFYCTSFEKGWTPLPETEEEVKALGALLRSDYGFETHYIKNPSKADIKDEIARWNARVRPNDQVLYFFSTHGYYDAIGDEGFLVPYNGKRRDTYGDTWLSYAELGRRVTKCQSKHVLLALDACYSGAFGDRFKGEPGGTPWEADADCADQVENALAYPTRRYFTSGSKNQRTPARSLFARRWLTALRRGRKKGWCAFAICATTWAASPIPNQRMAPLPGTKTAALSLCTARLVRVVVAAVMVWCRGRAALGTGAAPEDEGSLRFLSANVPQRPLPGSGGSEDQSF